jgi:hypothetical protein
MKENVVAAIAARSAPALVGPGEWPVLNPRKISLESKNPIAIAYSLFKSTGRFSFADNQYFSKKNGTHVSHYICGADNSLIKGVMVAG